MNIGGSRTQNVNDQAPVMEVPSYINELRNDLSRKSSIEFNENNQITMSTNGLINFKKNSIYSVEENLNTPANLGKWKFLFF